MLATLKFLTRDESAAPAVEYGVLLGFIALTAILSLQHLGRSLHVILQDAADAFPGSPRR